MAYFKKIICLPFPEEYKTITTYSWKRFVAKAKLVNEWENQNIGMERWSKFILVSILLKT